MTEPCGNVLGLILAGGLASRMEGRAKPLLTLSGQRLIDRITDTARAQCGAVALNLHDSAPETAAPFADLGLPVAPDAAPGRLGPLAGVLGGLEFAAAYCPQVEFVLSLPCDCPFLPDDLAERLLTAARESRSGLACASSGGRVHPVIALWPLTLREALRRALLEQDLRGVGQFQRDHDLSVVEWPTAPRDPFFNVNTPDDLALAEELLRRAP
ncbi:molybdenum cofactor guanylyltransferase MobA [Rhodoblastus sp.]|uniref:molybdenum cofactor guanylyltransferase MobA n=1 Tax=Rhodoblastus sp. TaxID=1962975 RepID=UPI0035B45639